MTDNIPMLKRRPIQLLLIAVVAVIAAVGGILWWLTKDDAPAAVDASSAAEVAASVTTTTAAGTPTTDAAEAGIEGTWTVDTSIGQFSFEDATSSFVGFRIDETLAGGIDVVAVGRTPTLSGSISIAGTSLDAVTIVANLGDITTNDSRRDNAARRAMNTSEFPEATFVLTSAVDLGADPGNGEPVSVDAQGDLTINGITQPVTVAITAQLVNGIVAVTGQTDIVFADWDIETPSAPIVASLDDFGILEMQLFFTR